MADFIYQVKFLSDWHCGSGLTSGSDVDALVIKDQNNLPIIPGKTIKGLLREAAETIVKLQDNKDEWESFITEVFGKRSESGKSKKSIASNCYFSNVVLSANLQEKLIEEKASLIPNLYRKIASTKIDKHGIAAEKSLRKIEVTIPLILYGKISNIKEEHKQLILQCTKYVKRLGTARNRGFGACIISEERE
ncbi:MAG: RAMP superfamily CRISPR-associated protein [Candidatus Cloacimonadales bacterium]|jgi:CRISPR/Cas system CSM-associated protein Csm3 (group 7 of RAMP superfamily)|nr:RAMP superfamily CRISPR-associated protein [Candidatus Cloacimonadales bacterium]